MILRLVFGVFFAPLVAALVFLAVGGVLSAAIGHTSWDDVADLDHFVLIALFAYPLGWLWGIPMVAVLRRFRVRSLRGYLIGGVIGGLLVGAVLTQLNLLAWLLTAIASAASGAFFWWVAVRPPRSIHGLG